MTTKNNIDRLDFVTTNSGKLAEFVARLEPLGLKVRQKKMDYPEIQADTLEEVVRYGLTHLGESSNTTRVGGSSKRSKAIGGGFEMQTITEPIEFNLPAPGTALAIEDSGLFVEALGGYPGVYSKALYMAAGAEGLIHLMLPWKDDAKRNARFETVIGLLMPDGGTMLFKGQCEGTIGYEIHGTSGFGFDPVFIPDEQPDTAFGELQAFGELTMEEKNKVSHRGRALKELVKWLGASDQVST